jgi:hypothetical protein
MVEAMIKNYSVKVTFNGITSLLNLIKIYQFIQKWKRGGDGETHTQEGQPVLSPRPLTAEAWVHTSVISVGSVMDKVAMGQVFP